MTMKLGLLAIAVVAFGAAPAAAAAPQPQVQPSQTHASSQLKQDRRTTARPERVIGSGTPGSCTWRKVVQAVRHGGVIGFDCGPGHVRITMKRTAKVRNTSRLVVLDGGGLVTLSGAGKRRILYQDTCDRTLVWTTSHCQDQRYPQLVLKNITLVRGDSTGLHQEGGGGGAVFVRGGRLAVVNTRFENNRCDRTGPDLGGAAIRVLDQYRDQPVRVIRSRFVGGQCSNGGALSGIGVSWDVTDSVFSHNRAIGHGANPARSGTPGGGSGGAIYADGKNFTVTLTRTAIEHNRAREGGGAVFFVSNDRIGRLLINRSTFIDNPSTGFETAGYPGIFFLGRGHPVVTASTLH